MTRSQILRRVELPLALPAISAGIRISVVTTISLATVAAYITPYGLGKPIFDYLASIGWPATCYPGCADMQVDGGRCVLGPENEAALASMDRAHVFTAVQLGEWGYYLHNLSMNEPWWHDVYGSDFDDFKRLMKPPGLAGYDRRPATRREGILTTEVGATFALDDIQAAVRQAALPGRDGKVLLRIGSA